METRYHLDENMHHAVANGLRRRGIDVTTSTDADLIGAADEEQLAFAHSQRRILVTHDDDLLRLHHEGLSHAGIAFCHPRRRSIGEIVLALTDLWRKHSAEEMEGQVQFL
jgi:uncharacterized protein with PIN domain